MKGGLLSGSGRAALPILAAMLASLFFCTGPRALGNSTGPSVAPWPQIILVRVVTGVSQPVHIANGGDGSGRLFVVDLRSICPSSRGDRAGGTQGKG